MPNKKQNKKTGNTRHDKKTGKFIHNVVKIDEARAYAANYYDKHQNSIDRLLNRKTTRNPKETFMELFDDLFKQNGVKYTSKKNLNAGIRSIIDELQGIDPRLAEIKRDALNREEAGFKDLRKLNKRVSLQEISWIGPDNIVGYYDIKDSDYVIVHKLDYTFSANSPTNIYEYETRVNAGLPELKK